MRIRDFLRFLCAMVLALPSSATTIVPMSVEKLTNASTKVVVAEATDSWTEWNADHTLIFTITRFTVNQSLKGSADQTVTVRQMGGRAEHFEQKVAGVRHWVSGDQAVLFLRPSEVGDGTMAVTGLMQGDFRVMETAGKVVVSNGVAGVHAFDPSNKSISEYSGTQMTLDDLKSRVKK